MKLVFPKPTGAQPRFPDQAQVDVSALLYLPPCVLHAPHIGAPPSTRWSTSSRASPRHAPASCHRHLCRRCLGLFQSCDDKSSKMTFCQKLKRWYVLSHRWSMNDICRLCQWCTTPPSTSRLTRSWSECPASSPKVIVVVFCLKYVVGETPLLQPPHPRPLETSQTEWLCCRPRGLRWHGVWRCTGNLQHSSSQTSWQHWTEYVDLLGKWSLSWHSAEAVGCFLSFH